MNIKRILAAASASMLVALAVPAAAFADTVGPINFENPPYTLGDINGQDGWSKTGALFDVAVSPNTSGSGSFGAQSLRTSDAVTSGSFGDQTFAKPLTDSVGESVATAGSFSTGTKQKYFVTQFDIASAVPGAQQPGMHVSVSPDRGDGSRMSYLRFEDGPTGLNVFFDDVQGTTDTDSIKAGVQTNFVETQIVAGLNRAVPHTVKLSFEAVEGASNDVVKVWIDGTLVHVGTSWENYYRFDAESSTEQTPRIVKTVLFRESGDANLADAGKGFLFDNLTLTSSAASTTSNIPTNQEQCKKDGYKNLTDVNGKAFKNQGDCVSYAVRTKNSTTTLNSSSQSGVNIPTVKDAVYNVTVSGTWANRPGETVDAECTQYGTGSLWTNAVNGGYSPDVLDVQVNRNFVDWGACDSVTHSYTRTITGTGSPINLSVFDGDAASNTQNAGWYGDNVGSLNVAVTEYPKN